MQSQPEGTVNEKLFLAQSLVILLFAIAAKKIGKGALTAWVAIQAIVANIFVLKQIDLLGFHVTASDAYVIGSLLGLNFLGEYHGQAEAKKATWICFFFMSFFAIVSQIHLLYEPSESDTTQGAFLMLLSPSARLLFASVSVFFIVGQIDVRFFAFLKTRFHTLSFSLRAGIALAVSQFLDTFLFSFAGLYGMVASVWDIIILSYALKLAVILFFTAFIRWTKA